MSDSSPHLFDPHPRPLSRGERGVGILGRLVLAGLLVVLVACGGGETRGPEQAGGGPGAGRQGRSGGGPQNGSGGGSGGRPGGGGFPGGPGGFGDSALGDGGVPVEVTIAARRPIASFFETNGTLEAENEVDVVARTSGPIVELATEEGRQVRRGQILARLDDREIRAQLEVSRVRLEETKTTYERAKRLDDLGLVSREALDQALANYQSAQGEVERLQVQLGYTQIAAPFSGLIVERYVKFAEHVGVQTRLFRISDFDPLLCPIQVPERELPRLRVGQPAQIEVEAWAGERLPARVLRISPVVNAATGTVKATLEVRSDGRLRPGMFASVRLEMERRPEAVVVAKAALALDSLGDTVFVAREGVAERREIELGFQNDDLLEVIAGVEVGEAVIVVGQDGLSHGTAIEVLRTVELAPSGLPTSDGSGDSGAGRRPRNRGPGNRGRGPFGDLDFNNLSPEELERIKGFMRERGLTDEQIEERLERRRQRQRSGDS